MAEPSAVIFVKPHLSTQSPDSAAIVEIVFSSQDYAEELDRLANPAVSEAIRQKLRAVDRTKFPQYRARPEPREFVQPALSGARNCT